MRLSSLNPVNWFAGAKALPGANTTARENAAQGPFTSLFRDYVVREAAPRLYEALREALPVLDGAIDKMVMLDGIVRIETENDRLQQAFDDWSMNVRVNDKQSGLQTCYELQSAEMYEQGLFLSEFLFADDYSDIVQLWVADSKGIYFRRPDDGGRLETWYRPPAPMRTRRDGLEQVERILRNSYGADALSLLHGTGYRKLDDMITMYGSYKPEADNPYGTSIMRSIPFVAKVLLTMQNALWQSWDRFGNPSFNVTYKTKSRAVDTGELERRRTQIANNLAAVFNAKRQGNSADFVNAIGKDDDMTVQILGGDGHVLEIEQPSRHVLEQIVAKLPMPSWMLGFHWSTAERLAERQSEIVLQESRTRFEKRKPELTRLITNMFRARGLTWKEGDWRLVQDLPSLHDMVAKAQAGFLEAQTELMRNGADSLAPIVDEEDGKIYLPGEPGYGRRFRKHVHTPLIVQDSHNAIHGDKVESYVENADKLTAIENSGESHLLKLWFSLSNDVIETLDVNKALKNDETVFVFDAAFYLQALLDNGEQFIKDATDEDKAFIQSLIESWTLGTAAAVDEGLTDSVIEQIRADVARALSSRGLELVRNATVRAYEEDVIKQLTDGVYDGMSRPDVARALRKRFDAHKIDWTRIVQTELATAYADGKLNQYAANQVELYDYVHAGDSKVSAICRQLAAGSPYKVGEGPLPGRDSHPHCRSTVVAHIKEE